MTQAIPTTPLTALRFVQGEGSPADHTACLMSAARILAGEASEADRRSDACSRVSPEIRRFAIGTNDWRGWASDDERTSLLSPLVPLLLDTVASRATVRRRLWILADVAVMVFAPIALDSCAEVVERRGKATLAAMLRDQAGRIRGCDEIVDRPSAERASEACRSAAAATAAAATATASATAAAAAAAGAAAAGAAAAGATAAAAAADAADAYVVVAADDLRESRRVAIRDALVGALVRVCAIRDK